MEMLEVHDLSVSYPSPKGSVVAMRDVSFAVAEGQRVGVVGESGSGKSTAALAIIGLLPRNAHVDGGSVLYRGQELLGLPDGELRRFRGRDVAMVFQNASTALNPLIRVGDQIADVIMAHETTTKRAARERAEELLATMGLPNAAQRARSYPHEYSGGMAQRALIAMALACSPRILIADEPTTGLDPIVEAQVLDKIVERVLTEGMSLILISHDIDVIRRTCTQVIVMYGGQVMESGSSEHVLREPRHPYSKALMAAEEPSEDGTFRYIPGRVPVLESGFTGCSFYDRCALRTRLGRPERCVTDQPPLRGEGEGSRVACHFVADVTE